MNEVTKRGQHAVVLGASMAGLLAARVLADFYDSVTVVDRDTLPETPTNRHGVPQGRHVHLLWGSGFRVLKELFPSLGDELIAAGVPIFDGDLSKVYLSTGGHPLRRSGHIKNFQLLTPSRRLLEFQVRRRVATLTNVEVLQGHDIVEPTFTAAKDSVTGAVIRTRLVGSNGSWRRIWWWMRRAAARARQRSSRPWATAVRPKSTWTCVWCIRASCCGYRQEC